MKHVQESTRKRLMLASECGGRKVGLLKKQLQGVCVLQRSFQRAFIEAS